MRTDSDLLKAALDAFDEIRMIETRDYWDLIEEIRARLAEPEGEPVAWMDDAGMVIPKRKFRYCEKYKSFHIPLYRHPPRQQVRLIDDVVDQLWIGSAVTVDYAEYQTIAEEVMDAMLEKSP